MNTYRVIILQHSERVHEIYDLNEYVTPPLKKGDMFDQENWNICDCNFTKDEIRIVTKDGVPTSMQDEMDDKDAYYHYLHLEDWRDLMYNLKSR